MSRFLGTIHSTARWQRPAACPNKNANVYRCAQTSVYVFHSIATWGKVRRLFRGRVNSLSLREDSNGNHIDRSSYRVFARRWWLGIFPLAQGLTHSRCQEGYLREVAQSAASFPTGGLPMATASIGGLEGLRLPDLLVLIKQTAECARSQRVLNPRATMVNDEIQQAKDLFTRARAWLLGVSPRRAEPKWRRPGDVEAAFFALYDALRSQIKAQLFVNREGRNDD
jgi:hypothetical protein